MALLTKAPWGAPREPFSPSPCFLFLPIVEFTIFYRTRLNITLILLWLPVRGIKEWVREEREAKNRKREKRESARSFC
jgi:hypothetical protein